MAVDSEKLLRTSVLQGVIGEDNVMSKYYFYDA
jgi:hypothetical protein